MDTEFNRRPTASGKAVLPTRLISACLLLDLFAAWLAPKPGHSMVILGVTIGFFFAQTIFIAVCTVLLPVNSLARVFFGAVAAAVVACAIGLHVRAARIEIVFVLAAAVICQWLIYQIPLWTMRRRGWQLQRVEDLRNYPTFHSDGNERQFGIQHILVWTSVVAIIVGLGKIISHSTGIGTLTRVDLFVFANLVLGNSVLALPTIYTMFVRDGTGLWLVGSIIWVALCTPILLFLIVLSVPMVSREEIWMFGILDLLQILIGSTLLYSLRRKGLRLVRITSGLNSLPESTT